ncbi:DsbE subfamily thiol:disulfide oxidoreductase [Rhodoblastus acidophilus]|uniref:redoxin family protein n=1 Tax=Rhodoblastus acidophilus TaxID=1074 RepID=UPI00222448CA|nr:redoxin family protein [Rhodoblastus acidophilus]MCW2283956.1 DsbE subfamily thiol:disulfide oxidoreductase [Rhodoblastus acidophilus]MCW2332652.1 DsbE subfamily thiol:disulfide oxidoreductase [Rhodoblastus acidophilus]
MAISSRRAVLLGAAGLTLGGLGAWRGRDRLANLFNPFAADRFDLPPLAGLTDPAGRQIPGFSAADIADKTVFLNAFASWCPQCREEHQALVDFARAGATIFGVASADDPENTLSYLRAFGNPYARLGVDRRGLLYRALGARGIPASFVLAPGPRIAFKHVGPIALAELQASVGPVLKL